MTTATPLSLPFVLGQDAKPASIHSPKRQWKPDRPNYRALLTAAQPQPSSAASSSVPSSRLQGNVKAAAQHVDVDQLEADLDEWGLPATESPKLSSSDVPRLAAPSAALSYDENSACHNYPHFQSRRPNGNASFTASDQWDPSISLAPLAANGLEPDDLESKQNSNLPFEYDPALGRVVAVGRTDGTVSIYRAYGRTEDYDSFCRTDQPKQDAEYALPASASASSNVSSASALASRRSSNVSNPSRLRSPDLEAPAIRLTSSVRSPTSAGRDASPLLSTLSPVERSSLAARSTVSAASISSTIAANVQLDEGAPASSLQSNITANGHTADRSNSDRAENRLELQMAAAERNDHQHGVVGGVIERLGLASHSHSSSQHQHSLSSTQDARPSHHRRSTSRRPSVGENSDTPSPLAKLTEVAKTSTPAKANQSSASPRSDAPMKRSISEAWLHDPTRGRFSPVMTLLTRDRSPVVALRLVPMPSSSTPSAEADGNNRVAAATRLGNIALLVVQAAGNVSLWSILEGAMLWQSDLTTANVVSDASDAVEAAIKDASVSLNVMHSLGRQLPASIGTPLARSPAGSARASPRPTFAGGDASMRRSMLRSALSGQGAASSSRLRDAYGVQMDDSVQILQSSSYGPLALLWDSHSSSALIIDLSNGRLMLHETLDDVHAASRPSLLRIPGSEDHIGLAWFDSSSAKLQKKLLRFSPSPTLAVPGVEDGSLPPAKLAALSLEDLDDADSTASLQCDLSSLPEPVDRAYLLPGRVVILSGPRLAILTAGGGDAKFLQEFDPEAFTKVCGSSRDSQHLLVRTSSAIATLDLVSGTFKQAAQPDGASQTDPSNPANPVSSLPAGRLNLAWNLPETGALLDKVLLLQPLASQSRSTEPISRNSATPKELAALDLRDLHVEDLLSAPGTPSADAAALSGRQDPQLGELDAEDNRITAVLPLSLERIAAARSGGISISPLSSLAASALGDGASQSASMPNSLGGDHEICLLRSATAPRSGHRLIIGGTLQGEVGFWTVPAAGAQGSPHPALEAALSVSTTPVEALVVFGDDDNTIRLHGCVACICADSSVTVVVLEGFRKLYTVPGRGARLTSLAVRADDLLLTYDDGKARVWDLRSQELRRSIATDQAQALVEDGKGWWSVKTIEPYNPLHSGTTGVLSQLAAARGEAAATLLVDFRRAIEAAARPVRGGMQASGNETSSAVPGGKSTTASLQPPAMLRTEPESDANANGPISLGSPAARKAVNIVRPLLPVVYPTGLDADIDAKLAVLLNLDELGALNSPNAKEGRGGAFHVGLLSPPDALMVAGAGATSGGEQKAKQAWKLSSRLTTTRLLIASALLRVLGNVSELTGIAEDLQRFVDDELQLSTLVGVGFRGITLDELVPYWLDSNLELQSAAHAMFQSALARLEQRELDEVCSKWHPLLGPAKSDALADRARGEGKASSVLGEATPSTRALALLGSIAVERYACLSPRLLKDIASTVHSAIVGDRGSEMRTGEELQKLAVAVELCRRGFSMWQHYFDATEVVRALFALSTSTSASSSGESELRSLARSATLQIAAENTPLFMTTLSLDILHARSAAHCAATMRLVAFMVRKRPAVLVANLPRLAEAVVKSLDPTHTTMREAVVNAATVMISELVSTYPSISFFGAGQRLAVGTHEGAVIMYDLKTATRLYVLEGHRRRADAVSFSPDGRRLVTMSLEEGRVLVWKTSSGFSSFFSPGQMPRQGATDAKLTDGAYKAFLFHVGDPQDVASRKAPAQASGTTEEAEFVGFDRIGFHWNTERSVRVEIGETQLNISVD
ncbi:uncharacterized protein PAN0_001c0385 [Moesziomyces antarcticus]|uniref:Uncharacterized protein n=1 Tax=Pseudozyma antarctica TaxID=84753 RepID=A0A5C3FE83_PSEA2|nr:uncharacterized protein PAN0_001c0385 [Moesziomyces antarcticus]GAK62187.1 conserved hypothetical protein [Moesziomyces antarcticus]SPO42723.1 uncharacterized protein PSANT_00406 [Moesziomyces antarcticus]